MTTAPPAPPETDPAAFVAALRRLKVWSGLSYRSLERRAADAGHALPYSTAATMLGRDRLPRAELVAAFVAACGLRGAQAEAWVDARSRIACGAVPPEPSPVRHGPSRRRMSIGVAALLTALLGGALAGGGAFTEDEDLRETRTAYGVAEAR
ncbi:hypothetical protein K4B79_42955 [Streptomyces lincolnensis]|uniref:hypothetical protein n=1 Tax=Streptomyces lincolnensis TaxID=1915 RepID=UPI001E32213B|nr:hypothetical protein [Streptomyces lincolnensis]MCD7444946.1 hypothetical protein [Streptomyces lincolnensis]